MKLSKLALITITSLGLTHSAFALTKIEQPLVELPEIKLPLPIEVDYELWENVDTSTSGIKELTITDTTLKAGASCSPTLCDWGTTDIRYFRENTSNDSKIIGAVAEWLGDDGKVDKRVELCHTHNHSIINVKFERTFTSGDSRSNYIKHYLFEQSGSTQINTKIPECVTAATSSTVQSNADIFIPRLNLNSNGVSKNYWIDLKFAPINGELMWEINDYGVNP